MRIITLLLALLLCCGLVNAQEPKKGKPNKLNGTWEAVIQEMGGKPLPLTFFFDHELVLKDSLYTFSAESVDKGVVKYVGDRMDIYGREGVNAGKHFTALYRLKNDTLTICYNLAGDGYPQSFVTTGKPMYFLSVFKRQLHAKSKIKSHIVEEDDIDDRRK